MLKDEAIYFYNKGYNCSQCVLKACEQFYKIPISEQCIDMCAAISSGFGIGGICSVLVSAVMIFGLMFNEATAKRLRIKFLAEFQAKYHSINCSDLIKERKQYSGCDELIADISDIIEKIIEDEKND